MFISIRTPIDNNFFFWISPVVEDKTQIVRLRHIIPPTPWNYIHASKSYEIHDYSYSKSSGDPDLDTAFRLSLLESMLDSLPLLLCTYSAGGMKWFFTLLNRVKSLDTSSTAVRCAELLSLVARHFQERSSATNAVLKARCVKFVYIVLSSYIYRLLVGYGNICTSSGAE